MRQQPLTALGPYMGTRRLFLAWGSKETREHILPRLWALIQFINGRLLL